MNLTIFDDCYPYELSGFRLAEYSYLLNQLPNARVVTTLAVVQSIPGAPTQHEILSNFRQRYPKIANRVLTVDSQALGHAEGVFESTDLLYTVFLNNALQLMKVAEQFEVPFVFTLYPGGGFALNSNVNLKLNMVVSHPLFAGVIVTQPRTLEWVRKYFPSLEKQRKLIYIFGGVLADSSVLETLGLLTPDQKPKNRRDLLFIGNKYEPEGRDKGFDIYKSVVLHLLQNPPKNLELAFHTIGPWNADDMGGLYRNVTHHGLVDNSRLGAILSKMDVALFPTRPHALGQGSLDGFPVGAAVECGKAGVAVVTTNPYKQKTPLVPGRDFLQIRATRRSVLRVIKPLLRNSRRLDLQKAQAQLAFNEIYSMESQMKPRLEFLENRFESHTLKREDRAEGMNNV